MHSRPIWSQVSLSQKGQIRHWHTKLQETCANVLFLLFCLHGVTYYCLHVMLSERTPGSFSLHVPLRHGRYSLRTGRLRTTVLGARQYTTKKKKLDCSWSTVYCRRAGGVGALALCTQTLLIQAAEIVLPRWTVRQSAISRDDCNSKQLHISASPVRVEPKGQIGVRESEWAVRNCTESYRAVISGDMHSFARIVAALQHNLKLKTRSRGISWIKLAKKSHTRTGSWACFVLKIKYRFLPDMIRVTWLAKGNLKRILNYYTMI